MGNDFKAVNGLADPSHYEVLRSHARNNRYEPTIPEIRLWECLRGKALGVKFRRQHIIGDCIADFACLKEMLIVEVDGGYHAASSQQKADADRDEYLRQKGFRVLRFTNDEVLNEIDKVLDTIRKSIIFSNH